MKSNLPCDTKISNAIQLIAAIAALMAAVTALLISEPKKKQVKVNIASEINTTHSETYNYNEFPDFMKLLYSTSSMPIKSHQVYFKISNISGFTLIKPTLAFRLPKTKMHPSKVGDSYTHDFRSNLFNSQTELRMLELAGSIILSNSNLPFWNDKDELSIWIRMVLDGDNQNPFTVELSVNSDYADGITEKVVIDPKKIST